MWAIPTGPLEQPVYVQAGRAAVLARVLAGLELGAFDRQAVRWLAQAPAPMAMAVATWLKRARESGRRLYPEEVTVLDDAIIELLRGPSPELGVRLLHVRQRLTGQGGEQ